MTSVISRSEHKETHMTKANNDYYIPKSYTEAPLLTHEDEKKLAYIIKNGTPMQAKRAKDRFVLSNMRLVMKEASKTRQYGLPYNELVQEGTLGLMHALTKYDPDLGHRFSTYAVGWIRQYMQRASQNTGSLVRIPIHQHNNRAKLVKAENEFLLAHEREATIEELSEITGMTEDLIKELRSLARQAVSLNIPVDDENGSEFGDLIADEEAISPEDAAAQSELQTEARKLFNALSDIEAQVLSLHVGMTASGETDALTHEAIANELGITKERVRYLIRKALSKLRHPVHTAKFKN